MTHENETRGVACRWTLWALVAVSAAGLAACSAEATPFAADDAMPETAMGEEAMDAGGTAAMGGDWSKPSDAELRERLTSMQYDVTQEDGTEPAFRNEYWDNKKAGIYVDVVSGEPLFSSTHKYESGTGWPSFWKPLEEDNIVLEEDRAFFTVRTEVRSKHADSHLGHVFEDGPEPTGLRYCMNSAALRFVPADRLEAEGYGEYASLFDGSDE